MESAKQGISCAELFSLIPPELIRDLEKQTKVNHQVKRMSGDLMLKILLFSLLNSERASLRVMEELCNSQKFRTFSKQDDVNVKRTTICDRIANINYIFFEKIFYFLYEKFQLLLLTHNNSKFNISRYDSTLVSLSSKLLGFGMQKDKNNRSIKFTMGFKNFLPSDVRFFKEQKDISEETALKKTILGSKYIKDSIVIFDRGLQNRKTFSKFSHNNIHFITRLKSRLRFKEIKEFEKVMGQKTSTLGLKKDIIVKLRDEDCKWTKKTFRLIIAISSKNNKPITFLTNIDNLTAEEITDIYRRRWDIEVFFKFLKQELNFKHLISRTENGIKVMLYVTLILALLLLVYKEKNHISGYKIAKIRFTNELDMELVKEIVIRCKGDIYRYFSQENGYG